MTARTMKVMIQVTIITSKMERVVLLPAVLVGISGDVHVAGMVGQLHVEGSWVTDTPVKVNKPNHFY